MPSDTALKPEFLIESEAALRALFPPTHPLAAKKCLDHLDAHAKAFISRSPFLCMGTQSALGQADVSPRGDPNGFVKVLDDTTLLIPDRPGNNRLDTLSNIVADPNVGILFMVPGFEESLRINGTAHISSDPELCALLEVNDRAPRVVVVVRVQEVYLHCSKAFRRAKLWDAEAHVDRAEMPSLMQMLHDQTDGSQKPQAEMKDLEEALEVSYKNSMY